MAGGEYSHKESTAMMRIGHGYDVHRYKEGRACILCGVRVPSSFGPDGHSDADVALHALMDAMLGALALGDIGHCFPDTDMQYKGISSMVLLERVYALVREKGYVLGNADITILAQKPKLAPYIPNMCKAVENALGAEAGSVSVKATTEEGLGFTGSLEGIAAHAVVLLKRT